MPVSVGTVCVSVSAGVCVSVFTCLCAMFLLGNSMGEVAVGNEHAIGASLPELFLINNIKMVHYEVCLNVIPGLEWGK